MKKEFTFEDKVVEVDLYGEKYSVKLTKGHYYIGNCIAIEGLIVGGIENGKSFATLTCNMREHYHLLGKDEVFIRNWSENESFADAVRKTGYFTDTAKRVSTGFVEVEIWRMIRL